MRSSNGYVWSEWSASEVVPLDQECLSTNTSSLEDERGSSMEDERGSSMEDECELNILCVYALATRYIGTTEKLPCPLEHSALQAFDGEIHDKIIVPSKIKNGFHTSNA